MCDFINGETNYANFVQQYYTSLGFWFNVLLWIHPSIYFLMYALLTLLLSHSEFFAIFLDYFTKPRYTFSNRENSSVVYDPWSIYLEI